jgi:hypothetical protein
MKRAEESIPCFFFLLFEYNGFTFDKKITGGTKMAKDISRRDFLKKSALGAAGIAAMGVLGGCGSTAASGSATPEPTTLETVTPVADSSADRVKGYCGPGDWLGEKPEISDSQISETYDYDIVVLGGGHSGLCAAFGAVDALGGAGKVAVIEQQPWGNFVDLQGTGANMSGWYGEDIGHVNSQFLIDRGYGPFNTGEIVSEFCKRASGRCNPDIIRAFVQNSGAMFDRYHEIYDMYKEDRLKDDGNVHLTERSL